MMPGGAVEVFSIDGTGYVLDENQKLYAWTPGNTEWSVKASFPEGYGMDYRNSQFIVCDGAAYFVREWAGFGVTPGQLYKYTP